MKTKKPKLIENKLFLVVVVVIAVTAIIVFGQLTGWVVREDNPVISPFQKVKVTSTSNQVGEVIEADEDYEYPYLKTDIQGSSIDSEEEDSHDTYPHMVVDINSNNINVQEDFDDSAGFVELEVQITSTSGINERDVDFYRGMGGPMCGNGEQEYGEQCDDGGNLNGDCCDENCNYESSGSSCDDGMFCTDGDYCDGAGLCISGDLLNCSDYDKIVDSCNNIPDDNQYTYDYYIFISQCNETADACTEAPNNWMDLITHTCDYINCNAECDNTHYCDDTECDKLDGCYDGTYRDYYDVSNTCNSCLCTDNTCDSYTEIITDNDQDGYDIECDNDCDDNDASIHPGAFDDNCNGIDENCNGYADEDYAPTITQCGIVECENELWYDGSYDCTDGTINICYDEGTLTCDNGNLIDTCDANDKVTVYYDNDFDMYGDYYNTEQACVIPDGYIITNEDCNDTDNSINPGTFDVCDINHNVINKDCNPDNDYLLDCNDYCGDQDEDGYVVNTMPADWDGFKSWVCPWIKDLGDCNDFDATINPEAIEICDGVDNDCDDEIDEGDRKSVV